MPSKLVSKVRSSVKHKLLELAGKNLSVHYTKSVPKFCEACIKKVQELYPNLQSGLSTNETDEDFVISDHGEDGEIDDSYPSTTGSFQEVPEHSPSDMRKVDLSEHTSADRIQLAYELGRLESNSIKSHARASSRKRDLETLLTTDVSVCHTSSSCNVLQSFLSGVSQQELSISTASETRQILSPPTPCV